MSRRCPDDTSLGPSIVDDLPAMRRPGCRRSVAARRHNVPAPPRTNPPPQALPTVPRMLPTGTERHPEIREAVRRLCARFPDAYHRGVDAVRGYPEAFVDALTQAGWLAAMIPAEYGGAGLGLAEASVVMEEINASGGNAGACHGQMYNMGTLLRHGSEAQKRHFLPRIASGEWRLQSMGVTEPVSGTDTTALRTTAVRRGDRYVVNGQKVWISRVQHSDWMILLARTTPLAEVARKADGLSIFMVDLRAAERAGMTVRPIANMVNHETNELFFENLEIPAEHLIGEEGRGFRYLLDGLNAERALIAAECIGDGRWFVERATRYAGERVVFGRPIGQNQGVQFPIAEAHIEVEAADLMRWQACDRFDARLPCGAQANMAKYLAAKASWQAAEACLQCHGGFGFAADYDIERKFRETRLYQVAPVSTNLILAFVAEHVLGLPRSY
jgi:acyl-CoA dehydrogenase